MIPWHHFQPRASISSDISVCIGPRKEYVHYLQHGPTMAQATLASSMMELAHERQFVVAQQGGESVEFGAEHTKRIDLCLQHLDRHFHDFASDRILERKEIPSVGDVGLWAIGHSAAVPTVLEIEAPDLQQYSPGSTDSQSSQSSQSTDLPSVRHTPLQVIEEIEFSDEQDQEELRTFFVTGQYRRKRFLPHGASRAVKSIKLRRRLKS